MRQNAEAQGQAMRQAGLQNHALSPFMNRRRQASYPVAAFMHPVLAENMPGGSTIPTGAHKLLTEQKLSRTQSRIASRTSR
jgi:hypothetical protein